MHLICERQGQKDKQRCLIKFMGHLSLKGRGHFSHIHTIRDWISSLCHFLSVFVAKRNTFLLKCIFICFTINYFVNKILNSNYNVL